MLKQHINQINFIPDFLASGRDENVSNNPPTFIRPSDHPKAMNHFRRRSRHQFNDAVSVCSSHKSSTSRQSIFLYFMFTSFKDLKRSFIILNIYIFLNMHTFTECLWHPILMRSALYVPVHMTSRLEIEQGENLLVHNY